MSQAQISYEEYIPGDKFAVQDMYLWGIQKLRQHYARIMRGYYNNGGKDARAVIDFYADADEFYWFAHQNISRRDFLNDTDKAFLAGVFEGGGVDLHDIELVRKVFQTLMRFASKSKLTELSESRPKGDFAYARARLGIGGRDDAAGE